MSLPVRPVKLSSRVRRNFKSRDWTSIGLRAAHASRKAGTRTNLKFPGSGLSHVHSEQSRSIGLREPAPNRTPNSRALAGKDRRGLFWIALIVVAITAAAAQVMK
jgi:hypothetical protein